MQKLYTANDIKRAFSDARKETHLPHSTGFMYQDGTEWLKSNKGKNGILKARMKKILVKHLQ